MKHWLFVIFCLSSVSISFSQNRLVKNGQLYFSWGYNKEWYSNSDIHIVQSELNSDYTFNNTKGEDNIGWDKLFENELTIPQYNIRLGYFFNEKQDWGIEFNFDHTKYHAVLGEFVRVAGKRNGKSIDSLVQITDSSFHYQLNNGANFALLNIVKRFKIYYLLDEKIKADALVKAGIGPLFPHVQNTIFGRANTPHFQWGGWNAGIEATIRLTFLKHFFIEYCNKIDYARYFDLEIYKGLANQSFLCYEMIGNAGVIFPLGKTP